MHGVSSSLKRLALRVEPIRALYESRNQLKIALDHCEAQVAAAAVEIARLTSDESGASAESASNALPEPALAIVRTLQASSDLAALAESRPEFFDDETEDLIRRHCETFGARSDFLGYRGPEHVAVIGDELREHLLVDGLNSRQRAIADLLIEFIRQRGIEEDAARIYGHEGITRLARLFRARFLRYLGSEYAPSAQQRDWLWPIPHADICQLGFPSESFDAIVSCDVLEHVPDLDAALREAARVLRHGGRFFATFPFHWYDEATMVCASVESGQIKHHVPPMYHGNPMDAQGGALVFQIPGWDVIERAKAAGFSRAAMTFICDQDKGIVASSRLEPMRPKGIFVTAFDR